VCTIESSLTKIGASLIGECNFNMPIAASELATLWRTEEKEKAMVGLFVFIFGFEFRRQ